MAKNVLVEYQGGGFDGCFWEWNYFVLFGNDFHSIRATGRNGVKTKDEAIALFKNKQATKYVYNLGVQADIDDFVFSSNAGNVAGVLQWLDKHADLLDLKAACPVCKSLHDIGDYQLDYNSYKGDGGIGIEYTEIHCESCESNYSCPECGEYQGKDFNNWGLNGECENCKPESLRAEDLNEEDQIELELMENEIAWLDKSWLPWPDNFDRVAAKKTAIDAVDAYLTAKAYEYAGIEV